MFNVNRVRKIHSLLSCILFILFAFQSCAGQDRCSLNGTWVIRKGRLTEKYEGVASYQGNIVSFYKDTVELASGFFYNTLGLNDEYPNGRYPFVYYGNKEVYKREANTLSIFSKPYNEWSVFTIECLAENRVRLIKQIKADTILLERSNDFSRSTVCNIRSIKVHVHKGTLDQFNVGYKVAFFPNDLMTYEQQDSVTENFAKTTLRLPGGTFKNICNGFRFVDLHKLKRVYPAMTSDYQEADIEIQTLDGDRIECKIQDIAADDAPDELRLALVPVLYLHQQYVYPRLKAKHFDDE